MRPKTSSGLPPAPRTSFVGRARELAELEAAVASGRLSTVVGTGGAGKTRLTLEWARRGARPVLFCDLTRARSVEDLVLTVAQARGLQGGDAARLVETLKAEERVVVLDNVEQLLPAAAVAIDAWLREATALSLVVTSRAPLLLDGERVIEVASLGVPGAAAARHDDASNREARDEVHDGGEASALFVERVRAHRPTFSPTAAEQEHIAVIVARLDGLPLAIELAAGRARLLDVAEIARQLGDKLDVLRSRSRSSPARHLSLRSVVAWSWRLLSADEQRGLARLSVFRGAFDLPAAEAVLGAPPLELLEALRDHALLRVDESSGPRFRLFESVRDFAAERLVERGELEPIRADLDRYLASVADEREEERVAWWCDDLVDLAERALAGGDAVLALRVALALEPVLLRRGPAALLLRLLDEAAPGVDEPRLLAAAALARGHALADVGQFEASEAARGEALERARRLGDRQLEARALASLGRHAWHGGRLARALALSEEALVLFEALGDDKNAAETRSHRANFRRLRGELEGARHDYLQAAAVLERRGDRHALAIALGNLASLEHDLGLLDDARRRHERALELLVAAGDRFHRGTFVQNLGTVLFEQGDVAAARRRFEEGLALHRGAGNRRWEGFAVASLARCDEAEGDLDAATEGYRRGADLAEQLGHPVMHAMVLCWQARLAAERGRAERARTSLERAAEIFRAVGDTPFASLFEVSRLHVELALDRAGLAGAARRGDPDGGSLRAEARGLLATLASEGAGRRVAEVRLAMVALERSLADRSAPLPHGAVLFVAPSGRGFRLGEGALVDLSTKTSLRRILAALVGHRAAAPGEPLSRVELLDAGWPGERMASEAGAGRVYTAVATLRRLGLRGVLLRRDDGYLLDEAVTVTRTEGQRQ